MALSGHIAQLEDSPRAKCRTWELVVNMPKERGIRKRRTRRFHGKWTEAQAALREFLAECEKAQKKPDSDCTFAQWAYSWHERRVRSGAYAANTLAAESTRLGKARAFLGGMKLRDVTVDDIETFYSELSRSLSPKSVEGVHKTLSTCFSDAVRADILPSAPTSGAKRPKVAKAARNVPQPERVDEMVRQLDMDDPSQRAVAVCACCGLRREEAVALDWGDFVDGCVTVCRAANPDGTPKDTKSGATRTVPVPSALWDALPFAFGAFAPMRPDSLTRWWGRHRADYGMDGVRLHDLRHAYVTRLALAGVHPRVMMELSGHASIDVCMEVYTHVDDSARRDAVRSAFA